MSGKLCPRPKYNQYKCASSFQGIIVSVYSAEKGLFYAIDSTNSEKFCEIVDFKPEELYHKPEEIKFRDVFIYYNSNSYLRAYRLNSFPANKSAIRSFLIDIGVEVFENFSPGKYFKLPDKFNYTDPFALFCNLERFPKSEDMELKSEFLENMMFRRMKFNVKRQTKLENALGSSNLCIVVDVEDVEGADEVCEIPNEFTWNTQPESPLEEENTFLPELSFMDGSCDEHVPFPANFILQNTDIPEPGEILMIYCTEVLNPSTLYACYNKKENFTSDYFPESLSVELLMNDDDVVESYENLRGEPSVGEMVITIGRDSRYHRGLVKAIAGDFYIVFFVDFGYTLPVKFEQIFKFPRECAALPFQAVHLTIEGMTSFGDPESDVKAIEIMSSKLSVAMAVVLSSFHNGQQLEMTVKVYDPNGINIVKTLEESINKPILSAE